MKHIELFEHFHVDDLKTTDDVFDEVNRRYRKFVSVMSLLKAYDFLDHEKKWSNNFISDFDKLLSELFLDRYIDMFCTSTNCRKRVKFKVKEVYYNISISTNRPTIVLRSQKATHFIDIEIDQHIIFVYSNKPFETDKWEKEFGFQDDVKKYNL